MLRVPTVENEIKEVKEIEINHIIDLRDLMDQGKESILIFAITTDRTFEGAAG